MAAVRATRARACDGKQRHPNREAAVQRLLALARKTGTATHSLNVYRCRHCQGFHIGHRPIGRRR